MMMPAWAAIVPELVPVEEIPAAVGLNSIAINVSRAIGPAIAGVLVAAVGPWLVFMLNALSYIAILAVLLRWRREHRVSTLPTERFFSAIRVGMRFVMHTRALQVVLIRGSAFFVFAAATWSLFPLIVRRELQQGPEIYGLLLTCIGIGAVGGAMLLPGCGRKSRAMPWSRVRAPSTRLRPSHSLTSRTSACWQSPCWRPASPGSRFSRHFRSPHR
jgi:MFS family permease